MSHNYSNPNFINKKRKFDEESSNPQNSKYPPYEKCERYHSNYKPYPQNNYGNNYYNYSNQNRYKRDYYPNRNYHSNNGNNGYYKKNNFQKYPTNDNEAVRNLSNCEIPSSKNEKNEKIFHNINGLLNNFKSQQNLNMKSDEKKEKKEIKDKSSSEKIEEENEYKLAIPKLKPKLDLNKLFYMQKLNNFSNPIEKILKESPKNFFEKYSKELNIYETKNYNINDINFNLNLNYLISKIPNIKIVLNFIDSKDLSSVTIENLDLEGKNIEKNQNKTYIIYDDKYDFQIDKILESNKSQKLKYNEDIKNINNILSQNKKDIYNIKNKISDLNFKIKLYELKETALYDTIKLLKND